MASEEDIVERGDRLAGLVRMWMATKGLEGEESVCFRRPDLGYPYFRIVKNGSFAMFVSDGFVADGLENLEWIVRSWIEWKLGRVPSREEVELFLESVGRGGAA